MASRRPCTRIVGVAALLAAALLPACGSGRADTPSPRGDLRVARKARRGRLPADRRAALRPLGLARHAARRGRAADPLDGRGRLGGEGGRARSSSSTPPGSSRRSRSGGSSCARPRTTGRAASAPPPRRRRGSASRSRRRRWRPRRRGSTRWCRGSCARRSSGGSSRPPGRRRRPRSRRPASSARPTRSPPASEIATARATEDKARREVAAVEKSLASMSLVAPKAGIFLVGNFWQWGPEGPRKLQPGDTVWPGYTVGTIPDPTEMEVQAALAESDHGRIAPGMKARCILDTYPDRVFEGRLEEVGSVARESGGRGWFASATKPGFPVRVSLARTDPLMRPGLSVRVEVVRGAWDEALSVPRGAVRFEKDGPVVTPGGRGRGEGAARRLHAGRVRRGVGARGGRPCLSLLSCVARLRRVPRGAGGSWPPSWPPRSSFLALRPSRPDVGAPDRGEEGRPRPDRRGGGRAGRGALDRDRGAAGRPRWTSRSRSSPPRARR